MPATAAMTPPVPLVLRRVEVRDAIARFVDVAFVDVLFVMVTPLKVDDAPLMMMPTEVVGERAPDAIVQSRNELLMKSTPGIAATTPPVTFVRNIEEVIPVNAKFVVVALVDVASVTVKACMVDEAPRTMMPSDVVGASAPDCTDQSLNAVGV